MHDEHPAAEFGAALSFVAALLILALATVGQVLDMVKELAW